MLATNETTLSFEKAIEEINAIIKLAGLSGGYSLGDKVGDKHNTEVFLAASKQSMGFSPTGDDEDDSLKANIMALAVDDFAHLTAFISMFSVYMLKVSGAVKNPSTMFDAVYSTMSGKLNQVATGAAEKFGLAGGGLGKRLHKDVDIERAANLVKDIAKVFDKYHS